MRNGDPYRLIFESSPLAIMATDAKGVITACNARATELFGAPRERLLGFSYEEIRDGRMRSAIHHALSGDPSRFEGEYLTVTGNVLTKMNAHFGPTFLEGRSVSGIIGVFEDLVGRRDAEKARREVGQGFEKTLEEVRTLRGLLPICAQCKSIREGHTWTRLEEYLQLHTEVQLTHSLCPECARKIYPELF